MLLKFQSKAAFACSGGPACMTDEEDIKGPEKRYLSESRRRVTNCAAAGQKYHLSEADKCANEGLGRRRDL